MSRRQNEILTKFTRMLLCYSGREDGVQKIPAFRANCLSARAPRYLHYEQSLRRRRRRRRRIGGGGGGGGVVACQDAVRERATAFAEVAL